MFFYKMWKLTNSKNIKIWQNKSFSYDSSAWIAPDRDPTACISYITQMCCVQPGAHKSPSPLPNPTQHWVTEHHPSHNGFKNEAGRVNKGTSVTPPTLPTTNWVSQMGHDSLETRKWYNVEIKKEWGHVKWFAPSREHADVEATLRKRTLLGPFLFVVSFSIVICLNSFSCYRMNPSPQRCKPKGGAGLWWMRCCLSLVRVESNSWLWPTVVSFSVLSPFCFGIHHLHSLHCEILLCHVCAGFPIEKCFGDATHPLRLKSVFMESVLDLGLSENKSWCMDPVSSKSSVLCCLRNLQSQWFDAEKVLLTLSLVSLVLMFHTVCKGSAGSFWLISGCRLI